MKLFISKTIHTDKLISEANNAQHWTNKYKRSKLNRKRVRWALITVLGRIPLPCSVKLIRLSSRKMDFDNLVYAFKGIRDEVADIIIPNLAKGRADGDERIDWHYLQEIAKTSGFRIEIYVNDDEPKHILNG